MYSPLLAMMINKKNYPLLWRRALYLHNSHLKVLCTTVLFDKLAQWHFFFALFYFDGDAPQKMTSCLFCGMAMDSFYVSIISLSLNYITSIYYDYDRLLPK